jgi:uncharacterized protein (DUF1778 family)
MLEPVEKKSRKVTFRATPSEARRYDTAAQLAGVSRSRVLREGAERLAREILSENLDKNGPDDTEESQ